MSVKSIGVYLQTLFLEKSDHFFRLIASPAAHVAVVVVGLVISGWGGAQLVLASQHHPQSCPSCSRAEAFKCLNVQPQSCVVATASALLTIDVAGAVRRPGIYQLKPGSRLSDALAAADGLSEEANAHQIAKTLNLATKLVPDSKIYFPKHGDEAIAGMEITPSTTASNTSSEASLLNINTASESELEELPSVGVVTAAKIIANRPYSTIDDLVEKSVVTENTLQKFKTLITIR